MAGAQKTLSNLTNNVHHFRHFSDSVMDLCVHTLSLDGIGVDGGIGTSRSTARLQDVLTHPPSNTGQLGGLQDESLAVLGQQLGSALVAGEW